MALTLSTMLTEFYARGLSDLNDGGTGATRATRWLNDGMHEIDELADWDYLRASSTGSVPLSAITDLRTIECVTDVANLTELQPTDRRYLRKTYGDLTTTGTAVFYYFTSQTTITTYPVTTATLTVDYWKFGPDLASGSDAPLMPDRFRMGIVHYAVSAGLADRGDLPGSQAARADGDRVVSQMLQSLLVPQHQGASQWVPLYGCDS